MSEQELQLLLQFFKTLADQTRLKILGLVSNQERSVGELADLLALKEPTVSHHLAKLKELDLVEMRAEGNVRLYRLNRAALNALNQRMFSLEQITAFSEDIDADAFEQKVFKDYFEDGQLKQIPTKQKKLLVVLRFLAEQFEPDHRYTEREVNAIIERYHPDFASLRRELIDFHFMQRENSIYWRSADAVPEVE
jgi:DNA-binding transcriptional ArsR family regulator